MASDLDDVPLFSDLRYEDLSVGQRWGPFVETIDPATSDEMRGAIGTRAPGFGAPLGMLPLLTLRTLRRALGGIIPGGVLARQHFSAVDVIPAGAELAIDVWISAQQQRPSGFYTTFTFTLTHDGLVRALAEWMILAPPSGEEGGG